MSRPKLLPPLAAETSAALGPIASGDGWDGGGLAPHHEVAAEVDSRLLCLVRNIDIAEKHFREMAASYKDGTLIGEGVREGGNPLVPTARWAKRCLAAFAEVSRVATEVNDAAFTLHIEAIRKGRDNPPMPMRVRVWLAWHWCHGWGRDMTESERIDLLESQSRGSGVEPPKLREYIPNAGEVAAFVSISDKVADLSVRDCTNHLKALGLPYAPARRGRLKSI